MNNIDLKDFIKKLEKENEERASAINGGNLSDYNHTVKVHLYNYTLDIIRQLKKIV